MQEAFVRVWERWEKVARLDAPTGYLYRALLIRWAHR
jgi:DNA-directed RNA polymerase specialized sigma24 family protein